jgi:hypothetical protein
LGLAVGLGVSLVASLAVAGRATTPARRAAPSLLSQLVAIAPAIDRGVLESALSAAACAHSRGLAPQSPLLTVIDYAKPSTDKRLWVFDLAKRRLLYHELVAHGSGTGENTAQHFSNQPRSHQTSLGLFLTGESYDGDNGYSMRLDGLEPGFNCQARERAIVMHGAPYVSEAFVKEHGRLGRSWGCPAVRAELAAEIIDLLRGGSLVYAHGPDPVWLAASTRRVECEAVDYRLAAPRPTPEPAASVQSHSAAGASAGASPQH